MTTIATRAAIVAAARGSETYAAIAARFGVTPENVRHLARRAGLPPRGGGRPKCDDRAARDAEIYAARHDGASVASLAARHDLSQQQVSTILRLERRRRAVAGSPPLEAAEVEAPGPLTRFDRWPRVKGRLAPTRIVAMTPFGPEVEHADPAKAAAERRRLWGGRYPKRPVIHRSPFGSPAASCAEIGG